MELHNNSFGNRKQGDIQLRSKPRQYTRLWQRAPAGECNLYLRACSAESRILPEPQAPKSNLASLWTRAVSDLGSATNCWMRITACVCKQKLTVLAQSLLILLQPLCYATSHGPSPEILVRESDHLCAEPAEPSIQAHRLSKAKHWKGAGRARLSV